jgi:hypothetical protein
MVENSYQRQLSLKMSHLEIPISTTFAIDDTSNAFRLHDLYSESIPFMGFQDYPVFKAQMFPPPIDGLTQAQLQTSTGSHSTLGTCLCPDGSYYLTTEYRYSELQCQGGIQSPMFKFTDS